MRSKLAALFVSALLALPAHALVLEPTLADPAREATAQALFSDMKCVVCEGQSLADSDAAFAVQMRAHIRRMLDDGATAADVRRYFTERYGEQILLTPPLHGHTLLLWAGPAMLVLLGFAVLWRTTRHGKDAS